MEPLLPAEVKKAIKAQGSRASYLEHPERWWNALFAEEKTLKKQVKDDVPPSTSAPKA